MPRFIHLSYGFCVHVSLMIDPKNRTVDRCLYPLHREASLWQMTTNLYPFLRLRRPFRRLATVVERAGKSDANL